VPKDSLDGIDPFSGDPFRALVGQPGRGTSSRSTRGKWGRRLRKKSKVKIIKWFATLWVKDDLVTLPLRIGISFYPVHPLKLRGAVNSNYYSQESRESSETGLGLLTHQEETPVRKKRSQGGVVCRNPLTPVGGTASTSHGSWVSSRAVESPPSGQQCFPSGLFHFVQPVRGHERVSQSFVCPRLAIGPEETPIHRRWLAR
jgi:hypothetical protein